MTAKQSVTLSVAVFFMLVMLVLGIFGEKGFLDYIAIENEKNRIVEHNQARLIENQALERELHRLENDPQYIESIARQELGMIGRNELIIKFERAPSPRSPSKSAE